MAPVRHRWSINDVIDGIRNTVMPSDCSPVSIELCDLSSELSVKLQRVQNMCVRYVCNIRRYDHISPSFASLSWLRLKERRTLDSLSLLFRILHTSTPNYLSSLFLMMYIYFAYFHSVVVITEDVQNVHLLLEYRPHIDVSLTCEHDPKLREYCSLMLAGNEFQSFGRAIVKEDEYEEVRWDAYTNNIGSPTGNVIEVICQNRCLRL
ncbi:hypothetical protein ANN_25623 [Periplaneta americana]|uniref:Uncharacterized protein n=1 Tax=Periplaneta americana TaxID=6978 RepID=A0ABQ8S1I3_PERAM|nr:hypothetical protein ANN_25623 [Periplaneta americana]